MTKNHRLRTKTEGGCKSKKLLFLFNFMYVLAISCELYYLVCISIFCTGGSSHLEPNFVYKTHSRSSIYRICGKTFAWLHQQLDDDLQIGGFFSHFFSFAGNPSSCNYCTETIIHLSSCCFYENWSRTSTHCTARQIRLYPWKFPNEIWRFNWSFYVACVLLNHLAAFIVWAHSNLQIYHRPAFILLSTWAIKSFTVLITPSKLSSWTIDFCSISTNLISVV